MFLIRTGSQDSYHTLAELDRHLKARRGAFNMMRPEFLKVRSFVKPKNNVICKFAGTGRQCRKKEGVFGCNSPFIHQTGGHKIPFTVYKSVSMRNLLQHLEKLWIDVQ